MANRCLTVIPHPQWRMGRKNEWQNRHRAHHPHMRLTVAPIRGEIDRPHTQSHAQSHIQSRIQGLVHGQDQPLRIRGV